MTTAFAVSALVHTSGDYVMFKGRVWFSPQFFMAQPFALMLEAAIIRMADTHRFRQRFPVISSTIGRAWALAWFSLTFPDFVRELWGLDYILYLQHAVIGSKQYATPLL